MRIAQVTLRFDAPGGVETTVRELSRRLRAAGESVEVFASDVVDESRWTRGTAFRSEVDGIPVHRFRAIKRPLLPGYSLPVMPGLVDALADGNLDLIHAHSHRYGHVLQSAAVAARVGTPLVVSTHYHPADRREPPVKRALLRAQDVLFGATAYRHAAAIVVETEVEAQRVRDFAPAHRIRIIPPGIDLAEWSSTVGEPALPAAVPGRYFLFVGRVASNKGLPLLFEALARIPSGPDRLPLVLMGPDWGQRSRLEREAQRLGLSGSVHWLGPVEDRALWRAVVRRATALVLPSEWEAFGMVLVEALAAGTPVVATAVGGVPEVLVGGRAGRLVRYGDPNALAEALQDVSRDPETTRRLVEHGRVRAAGLDWSECARRHLELYRDLVGR